MFGRFSKLATGKNLLSPQFKDDEVRRRWEPGLAIQRVGRGLAVADYDKVGDLLMVVIHMNDAPDLLRHSGKNKKHSILVKTIVARSNRDGTGNEVKVVSGGPTQYDQVRSGAGGLSSSDLRLHFGFRAGLTDRWSRMALAKRAN
jgi:hypothetical protein